MVNMIHTLFTLFGKILREVISNHHLTTEEIAKQIDNISTINEIEPAYIDWDELHAKDVTFGGCI